MTHTVEIELHTPEELPDNGKPIILITGKGYTITACYFSEIDDYIPDDSSVGFFGNDFCWYYPPITKDMAFNN